MQQKDIFSQYQVFSDETSVKAVLTSNGLIEPSFLSPHKPLIKQCFEACIDNIQKRNSLFAFRGKLIYLAEIQNVYSYFRALAPTFRVSFQQYIWKHCRVHISTKFQVQIQCNKCGDYISPFLTGCGKCLNYAYCSEQCLISDKYQHLSQCKRNPCPSISGGLPVEIHVGGHLQENIEVKYCHEEKMSYKIKGRRVVSRLNTLIQQCPQLQESSKEKKSNITINKLQDVQKVYINSPALINLRLILLRQGCIFKRMESKDQSDNIHIILHYLYPI